MGGRPPHPPLHHARKHSALKKNYDLNIGGPRDMGRPSGARVAQDGGGEVAGLGGLAHSPGWPILAKHERSSAQKLPCPPHPAIKSTVFCVGRVASPARLTPPAAEPPESHSPSGQWKNEPTPSQHSSGQTGDSHF